MKTNTRNLSSNFFNFRLFLEGLKRLRVIGLATAILALTVSAVIPIVALLESLGHAPVHTNHVETPIVCIPMPFVIILMRIMMVIMLFAPIPLHILR